MNRLFEAISYETKNRSYTLPKLLYLGFSEKENHGWNLGCQSSAKTIVLPRHFFLGDSGERNHTAKYDTLYRDHGVYPEHSCK